MADLVKCGECGASIDSDAACYCGGCYEGAIEIATAEANAKIEALKAKLTEAVKGLEVAEAIINDQVWPKTYRAVRLAIAKARGEEVHDA